jgi:hypothetical protein
MEPAVLSDRIEDLVLSLSGRGHRSVWVTDAGAVWHAEPEDDLTDLGARYLATMLRPSREEVAAVLLSALPVGAEPLARIGGFAPAASLVPAVAS